MTKVLHLLFPFKRYKKVNIFILVPFLLLLHFFYKSAILYNFKNRFSLGKADAAIVLGAATFGKKPSPVFKSRIDYAVQLFKNKLINWIIFTGGMDKKNKLPEAVVAQMYAHKQGVPSSRILIETKSKSTKENLIFAKNLAKKYKINSFLIISDPYHMKRAMNFAESFLINTYPAPVISSRYKSYSKKLNFLIREMIYTYINTLISIKKFILRLF